MSLKQYIRNHYCKTLKELAKIANPNGVILELGVGSWGSGIWLCEGAGNCPVYGVDNFSMEGISVQQILGEMIRRGYHERLLIMDTIEAALIWSHPISLLFIDACHSYEACLSDFFGFYPHVIDGGFIVFHDSERAEIQRAVKEVSHLLIEGIETVDDDGRGCYFAKKK